MIIITKVIAKTRKKDWHSIIQECQHQLLSKSLLLLLTMKNSVQEKKQLKEKNILNPQPEEDF